jgi:hypothetical protein
VRRNDVKNSNEAWYIKNKKGLALQAPVSTTWAGMIFPGLLDFGFSLLQSGMIAWVFRILDGVLQGLVYLDIDCKNRML